MTTADVHSRLKHLFDASKGIAALTTQLAKWNPESEAAGEAAHRDSATSTPRNRSTSNLGGPSSSHAPLARSTSSLLASPPAAAATDRLTLAADIHQRLKDLEDDYDLLTADTAELAAPPVRRLDSAAEKARLGVTTQLQRLAEDIAHLRSQFRKAQLQAKRTADASTRVERARLFAGISREADASATANPAADGGSGAPYPRRRNKHAGGEQGEDGVVRDAAADVTLALRRTHQRMQAELHRSEFARATLQRSNQALQSLTQSYSSLDDLFTTSRGLITTLAKSNKSDTWYLETALWILVATVAWLFFRRILYGPGKLLLWIPGRWILQALFAVVNVALSLLAGTTVQAPGALGSSGGYYDASSSSITRIVASGKGATRGTNMPAPSMHVGGGGKDGAGGEMKKKEKGEGEGSDSLVEQVGEMAEATRAEQDETVLRDRRPDEPVNPKKRMMEEPPRDKDEL